MQLVDGAEMDVQAVQRGAFRVQCPKGARGLRDCQVVRGDAQAKPLHQCRRSLSHPLGVVEDDAGLLAGGRRAIHLRAWLAVGGEHVQRDAGRQGRLGILARHLDVDALEPALAAAIDPAEHDTEDEALPVFELDGRVDHDAVDVDRPCPIPLDVRQQLNEPAYAVGPRSAERKFPAASLQVRQVALACQPDPLAGEDLAGYDSLGIT